MTAVKICGLTRVPDVELACRLGAAYAGFNFVPSSPRRVAPADARELVAACSPGMLKVGVFAEGIELEAIQAAVVIAGLDLVQFHGLLTEEFVESSPVPVIAVARMANGAFAVPRRELLVRCHAVLFDPSEGAGSPIDPSRVEEASWPVPVLVAGGLTPETVADVIRRLRPAGVDVASGVESVPGIKDHGKVERFFAAVKEADASPS